MSGLVQYSPWTSDIELAFYSALANLKINHDKLDSSARKVLGLYEIEHRDAPERSTRMQIHGSALTSDEYDDTREVFRMVLTLSSVLNGFCRAEGVIRNFNTIEEYRQVDKAAHIERAGHMIWDAINDGTIYSCPSLLASFSTICFADLKKYKFSYHFAYPALHSDPPWRHADDSASISHLTQRETTALVNKYQTWKYGVDTRQHGFFLAKRIRKTTNHGFPNLRRGSSTQTTDDEEEPREEEEEEEEENTLRTSWAVSSLASFDNGFFNNATNEDRFVCFVDPSTYPTNPGWPMRNLLVLVRQRFKLDRVQILCYRDTHLRREHPTSIVLDLRCGENTTPSDISASPQTIPKVTGWERNTQNKAVTSTVDLAAYLDPARLADQAVDLNLKLIKWRIAPSIDLDIIKNSSCLLLGAGTLGSYVARNLMGWGARKITFVDNGKVSYSNPVRQPLYNFQDCLNGGAQKALRAAEALREIYPGAEAEGHVMSVPMAGHPISDEARVKADYDKLLSLIESHDAIFLLMDTRESRWLPTVMAKAAHKIVINAALGFDTYMVMRHGVRLASETPSHRPMSHHAAVHCHPNEEELGCYFCSDVVAPADSLKSATLDQQCTVTRPGIAPIASALAVELLVSILQSPQKARVPAPNPAPNRSGSAAPLPTQQEDNSHPLGTVPHQLRGFLSNWQTLSVKGKAYDCCSACSPAIVGAYERDGWAFVKRAISEKGFVEEVSGLAEVQRRAEEAEGDVDWDSGDEDEEIL